jgi:hypothetical protein
LCIDPHTLEIDQDEKDHCFEILYFVFHIFIVYGILHMDGMQCKAYAQSGFFFLIMENGSTVVKMLYLACSVGGQTVLSLKTFMCV